MGANCGTTPFIIRVAHSFLVREIFDIIKKIREQGATVLIVEQNVKQTLAIADRAYVLESGRVVMQGTGAALLNAELLKAKGYLG